MNIAPIITNLIYTINLHGQRRKRMPDAAAPRRKNGSSSTETRFWWDQKDWGLVNEVDSTSSPVLHWKIQRSRAKSNYRNTQSSDIIKGKAITEADLKDKNKYFSNEELAQVDSLAKNHKAIKDYWLVVMENFFPDELSPSDKEIAKAILDISSNITEERLELSVELTGNPWIK